ncbi:MAG: epoxyqueuosine reductase QueH [Clostridia bacterium]|nr:epoxyqueuosine reductase QueH [Clostridia bacterium]
MQQGKVNYKKLMDNEIERVRQAGRKPTLLLHACCAPCSSAVLEVLRQDFDITVFFYNPNIEPESEFLFRLEELQRLLPEMGLESVDVVAPPYDAGEFREIAVGLEALPEGGERCKRCYRLRLEKTISYAKEQGFEYVTTTLSVSPYKNAVWLNEIGRELGEKYGVSYLVSDFKKGEGYKRSCLLSKEYNLYRQDYCGCRYSKAASEVQKSEKLVEKM